MNILELIQKNSSKSVYQRGQDYFKNNKILSYKITDVPTEPNMKQSFIAIAQIQGNHGGEYHSSVVFQNGNLLSCRCDCPAFETPTDMCKHLVALLLQVHHDMNGSSRKINTPSHSDPSVAMLLSKYHYNLFGEEDQNQHQLIHLWPKLFYHSNQDQFALEFTIGTTRPYVLKSIYQFALRFQQEEYFRYGKDLGFVHTREQFEPRSQFYIDLICETNEAINAVIEHSQYYISRASLLGRELPLSASQFDTFFRHVENEKIPVSMSKLMVDSFLFITRDPQIQMAIDQHDNDIFYLNIDIDHYIVYETSKFGYLFHQNIVYRCSEAYRKNVFPILLQIQKNSSHTIRFVREELASFISLVLPQITPHAKVDIQQHLLDDLRPAPLEARLYFDYPEANTIRAKCQLQYGEHTLNPLDLNMEDVFVQRDPLKEHQINTMLQRYHFIQSSDSYYLYGEDKMYEFLTQGLQDLMPLAEIFVEDKLEKMKSKKSFHLAMDVTMTKGILEIKFDDSKFSKTELADIIKAYQKGKKYIILKDNTFLDIVNPSAALIDQMLTDFDLTSKDLKKSGLKLPAYRGLYLDKMLETYEDVTADKSREYIQMIRDIGRPIDTQFQPPENLQAQLRHYQLVGYRWLKTLSYYGFGGILADDMGLGKTLQTIALLLSEAPEATMPSMIVAPTSLIYNWQRELEKFAPSLNYLMISGTAEQRKSLIETIQPHHIVITSYDSLKRDIDYYQEVEFTYCIADEAQYIKNHYTQNAQAIKSLASRIRFALTGTPMENSLADLWSIMDYVMPGYLMRWQRFKEIYEIPITRYEDQDRLARLQQQIAPFLLRRIKKEVLTELPDKIETTLYATLSLEEEKIYHAQLAQSQKEFLEDIAQDGINRNQIKILALITRLRQACCHPSLFLENYHGTSSKLDLCLDLVKEKIQSGSQIIIFSQFTSMLDLLAAELSKQNISYLLLTGQTKSQDRMQMVNDFNHNGISVFLISLKAGGVGLNLVAADTVVHFDPWWNLSAQNQATDRAHRIGQDKKVHVIKLIAKDTIEEKIEILQNKKQDLTDAVISQGQTFINKLGKEEIEDLFDMNINYI